MKIGAAAIALALLLGGSTAPATTIESWLPVREVSLEIRPGSPLDFSGLLPNTTIGPEGARGADRRLIAGAGGRMAFADAPDRPQRLFCASLAWSPASGGFPSRDEADRYARQLAMHGYNLARLHFVDAALMFGRQTDFDFDPDTLDRIHYLLAALKRNGIYWMIDAMSSWRGAYGGYDDRWDPAGNLKTALYFDERAFAHWRRFQEAFLARVNPYTGVAPISDEALAVVILVNENSLEFESVVHDRPGRPPYDPMIAAPFNRWLSGRYASTADLARAWGDLARDERLEEGTVRLPRDRYVDSPRLRDLQAFFTETERASAERMTGVLRGLGYRGLVSTYNNWPTVQTALSRRDLDAVTMNTYHDWVGGYEPGSSLTQESSLVDGAGYIRMAAASRWLGKPFAVSEWDHLFWNRHRYEAGLAMPAYAALQGWDALCRHGHGPIVLSYGEPYPHKRAMLPYAIALDPVARAGETLAALIYRRGDVAQSRLVIPFAVRGEADLGPDMQAREPPDLTQLALVSRIGLADEADARRAALFVPQPRKPGDADRLVGELRRRGDLPAANRTSLPDRLYESDTGEIFLDARGGQLRVSTAATEGVAFSRLAEPVDLGTLSVAQAEGGALIALSTLDKGTTLRDGKRLLLIFATDARNSDMRFCDRGEKVIEDFGRLPVLIRKAGAQIALAREGRWTLSPVGLDGAVHAPMARGEGAVSFTLTNDVPSGPTTFFLLEIE
ncbi:hypothetical protein ATER59S_04760 [Aquamicrobium terrae]